MPEQEMTLDEYVGVLPRSHRAHGELAALHTAATRMERLEGAITRYLADDFSCNGGAQQMFEIALAGPPATNTRSLEERLNESSFRHEAAEDAAEALARKDKLLVEAIRALDDILGAFDRLPTSSNPGEYLPASRWNNARTTIANLKAEMGGK